jgi:protein required for attachment to host cells
MRIAHDALVLVADGRKSLFLRNEGDGEHLNLVVEDQHAQAGLKDRELKADASGQSATQRGSSGHGTMGETDFHQQEEDRFAADTAALLTKRAQRNEFEELIIVAPPRTLGELRQHYDKAVEGKIVAEVDKDLVNHPIDKLEGVLKAL